MSCAQTKNGRRIQVSPLARSWMIVVMKLTAPRSEDVIKRMKPTSQSVCPFQNQRWPGPVSAMTESGV